MIDPGMIDPMTDSGVSDPAPESSHAPGVATGLFRSLTTLFATLLTLAQTRLELLTTELQEEVQRAAGLVVWSLVALVTVMMGLFMAGLTIVFAYWETNRVLAALMVSGGFVLMAGIAVFVLVAKINSRPRFLAATLTELAKDSDALKSRME